jgi:hypothetical protein
MFSPDADWMSFNFLRFSSFGCPIELPIVRRRDLDGVMTTENLSQTDSISVKAMISGKARCGKRVVNFAGIVVVAVLLVFSSDAKAQFLNKTTDDVSTNYTNVGSIGLTVTNFGTLGTRNAMWPNQPSCEYPLGSRIEHLYQAGLWIGAKPRNSGLAALVSTGATDRSGSSGQGYEFTTENGSTMVLRSSLSDSRYFQPNAISHQDFVGDYSDTHTRVPATGVRSRATIRLDWQFTRKVMRGISPSRTVLSF